jgi:hypothetical protein
MEKSPAARFQTVDELVAALRRVAVVPAGARCKLCGRDGREREHHDSHPR